MNIFEDKKVEEQTPVKEKEQVTEPKQKEDVVKQEPEQKGQPTTEKEVEVQEQEKHWITKDEFNYTMTQILDEWGCAYYYHEYDGINSVEFQVSDHVRIMAYLKDDDVNVSRLSIFTINGCDEDEYSLALNLFDVAISGFTDDVHKVEEIKEAIVSEYGYTSTNNFGYEFKYEDDGNISIKIAHK